MKTFFPIVLNVICQDASFFVARREVGNPYPLTQEFAAALNYSWNETPKYKCPTKFCASFVSFFNAHESTIHFKFAKKRTSKF